MPKRGRQTPSAENRCTEPLVDVVSDSSSSSEPPSSSECDDSSAYADTSSSSSSHPTNFTHEHTMASRDEAVEAQLDRLQVDEDLKASILAMDAETQREMINDIIRNKNMVRVQNMVTGSLMGTDGEDDGEEPPRYGNAVPLRGGNFLEMLPLLFGMGFTPHGVRGGDGEDPEEDPRVLFMQQLRDQLLVTLQSSQEQHEALRNMGIDKDIDEMSYEELLDLEERMGSVSKGISDERARACLEPKESVRAEDGQCMVCLDQLLMETLEDGVVAVSRVKNCDHMFHDHCILGWLKENKICPICKKEVLLPSMTMQSSAEGSSTPGVRRGRASRSTGRGRGRGGRNA